MSETMFIMYKEGIVNIKCTCCDRVLHRATLKRIVVKNIVLRSIVVEEIVVVVLIIMVYVTCSMLFSSSFYT